MCAVTYLCRLCGSGYGWRCLSPRHDPLLTAERHMWVRVQGGGTLMALRGREAFFAMPFAGGAGSADALVRAMCRTAAWWGAARLSGPASPRLFDLNGGLRLDGGARGPFDDPPCPQLAAALLRAGFMRGTVSDLYEVRPGERVLRDYSRAARYVSARYGLSVKSARHLGDRAACEAVARVSLTDERMAMAERGAAEMLIDLGSGWDRNLTQIAFSADSRPIGYLLALRRGTRVRVASAQVDPAWRGRAVTALMGDRVLRALDGAPFELGVIARDNAPSCRCALALGGSVAASYAPFALEAPFDTELTHDYTDSRYI